MKRYLVIAMLISGPVLAQPTDQDIHDVCQQHLNIKMGQGGRVVAKPGYEVGWESCESAEKAYRARMEQLGNEAKERAKQEHQQKSDDVRNHLR